MFSAERAFLLLCQGPTGALEPRAGRDARRQDLEFVQGYSATVVERVRQTGEAVIVAPMQYSQILWATAYGMIFFDEWPDGPTTLGASIIIASGLYIVLRESRAGTSANRPVTRTGRDPLPVAVKVWPTNSRISGVSFAQS